MTSVTPPLRPAHDFTYTVVDQVSSYTPPDAGFAPRQTSYAYNADGQVTTITRPDGQVVSFSYEASGRPDFVTLPSGVVDYTYDASSGRVSSVAAPGGVQSTYSYEGPLLSSIATSGPVPGTVSFGYDADLRPSSQTLAGGPSVSFGYDADGLLTSAGALTLTRDVASGQLESTTLGTTSDVRTRTGFAELDVYTARISGETLYSYDLDRDVAGRIRKKTETVGNVTRVWEYEYYPERGWLKEVKRDNVVVESYVYDGNGNRTAWSDFWGTSAATYDAQDRMLSAGGATYTYTNNGELHEKTAGPETTVYTYDVRGALVGVDLPNGIAISYVVDADGRRIGKRVNGVLTKGWLYAGGLAPVAEVDALGQVTATFVYATKGNVPDYVLRDGTSYRLFTDHLGSVRLVVETTTGALVQQIDYDAFGRILYDSNPGFQPFGFAGGLYDPQTGLTRFGARDYDPEVGRWTSKDPIGFAGGDGDLYGFVSGDPVNKADPSGLADCHEDVVVDGVRLGGPLPAGDVIRPCTPTLGKRFGDWLDSISPMPSHAPIGHRSRATVGEFRSFILFQIMGGIWDLALAELAEPAAAPLIHTGKQGKHIPGHNNFVPGRSILTADPESLAVRAGTGTPMNSVPRGQAGFKERIDFGETIGIYVEDGVGTPTTSGMIIYAADGTIHIVPTRP